MSRGAGGWRESISDEKASVRICQANTEGRLSK